MVVNTENRHGYGDEQHMIPYVDDIIAQRDDNEKLLLIQPPQGLLGLAQQAAALQYLEPLLQVNADVKDMLA